MSNLLIDCTIVDCPQQCHLQVWAEDDTFHLGPACDSCTQIALDAIHRVYPHLPARFVY